MPADEKFEWKKLIKGFFVGKNYWKAFVFSLMAILIWSVIFCIFAFVKGHIPNVRQDTRIEGNTGVINQHDNHANTTENHWYLPLSELFQFGSKGKRVQDGQ